MKTIATLCLLLASAAASAQSTYGAAASAPAPRSKPAPTPLEKAYGPAQAMQFDAQVLQSPILYMTVGGRQLKFNGANRVLQDSTQIWDGRSEDGSSMQVVVRPDRSFNGVVYSGARIFEFWGAGNGAGVIQEHLGRPTPDQPALPASGAQK